MELIRDVWVDTDLQSFDSLLWEWITVLERLTREWEGEDYPWWYNERACIGMFAAAIWRSGGTAFEEYTSEKTRDRSELASLKKPARGRTDLYFSYFGKEYIVEAKQWWPDLARFESHITDLADAIKGAENDVQAVNEKSGEMLTIVFAIPKAAHSVLGNLSSLVRDWKDRIDADENDYSARALFFPEVGSQVKDERWVYPGIGIFLKQI